MKPEHFLSAVKRGRTGQVRRWFDDGGSPNVRTEDGRPVGHLAAEFGSVPVLQAFSEYGVNLLAVNQNNGETAGFAAARNGHRGALRFLVENGIDVNHQDEAGNTLLHEAVLSGQGEVVSYLTGQTNIDVSQRNADGATALDIARQNNSRDLAIRLGDVIIDSTPSMPYVPENIARVIRDRLIGEDPNGAPTPQTPSQTPNNSARGRGGGVRGG